MTPGTLTHFRVVSLQPYIRGAAVKIDDKVIRGGFIAFCDAAERHSKFVCKYNNTARPDEDKLKAIIQPQGK